MPSDRGDGPRHHRSSSKSSRHSHHAEEHNSKSSRDDKSHSKSEDHRHHHRSHHHQRDSHGTEKRSRSNHNDEDAERRHHKHRKVVVKEEPPDEHDRHREDRKDNNARHAGASRNEQRHEWGKPGTSDEPKEKPVAKEAPNFELSGKLTEDTNTFNGVVIKYNEPPDARKPKRRWRLYPFKGDQSLPFIPIHRQSAYLIGRMRLIADLPIDHPSCSKQHAVFQYRLVDYEHEDGTIRKKIRPYIIDLESSNGTYVNNQRIEPRRYVELFEKDVLKFGYSTREYVLLHEDSKDEAEDDNVVEEEETAAASET